MEYEPLSVRVWGEYACFTRPDMKVERVSYAVPTPSGARGILEAIFWKPEFRWVVQETRVHRSIGYASFLRNEVKRKVSYRSAQRWESTSEAFSADSTDMRTQRHTLALADVAYTILAQVEVREGVHENPAKYRDQFRRRVKRGQCHTQPYLGCREFAAYFGPADPDEGTIGECMDLGPMLYDLDYSQEARAAPVFFPARLERGVVRYPAPEEVGLCF
ncbi:MAG: type I-C CRISPR-associated protein Cas5 [Anaerolineales bacterium]|nr:type I-C CRISPR-associated protein Cas5 [Anaerolineales bacterium]